MIDLIFHESIAYPLFKQRNISLRGYFDCNEVYFHNKNDYTESIFDFFKTDNIGLFKEINGNFFVVSEMDYLVLVIADRINSFPIYYYRSINGLTISDRLPECGRLSPKNLDEYLACGFVIGSRTVYQDVFQLQAGQVLIYDKRTNEYCCKNYYGHIHHKIPGRTDEWWINELREATKKTMDHMIERLNGRHVALFLSGGYDSKLIISELRKRNYENVTCIILGSEQTKDVIVAKKVAEALKYKYIHITVDKKFWREKQKSGYMDEYFMKCARFSAMPYLQGVVLKDLIDNQMIPSNCVAVTGNSGDVVEGNDVTHCFHIGNMYCIDDLKKWIVNRHFMLNGMISAESVSKEFDFFNYLVSEDLLKERKKVTAEEAEDIIEYFNWRERQCKYVVQDVRNYDYIIGTVEWLLPLWDNEFVDFWLKVPYELRYDRRLYYQFLGNEKLPSANSKSLSRKLIDFIKQIVGNHILPLYIIKAKYDFYYNDDFYFATYGLADKFEFKKIIKETKGYREPHSENIARKTAKYFNYEDNAYCLWASDR